MNNKILIIAGIVVLVAVGIFYFSPYAMVEHDMYLTVEYDNVGINVDTDAVWFGGVVQGGASMRPVILTSSRDSKVVVKAKGEFAEWVSVSQNNFKIKADEPFEVQVKAHVPQDAELRNYEGTVVFYFFRD